jgi:hypothetical protein
MMASIEFEMILAPLYFGGCEYNDTRAKRKDRYK